jgi:hypothetical protein
MLVPGRSTQVSRGAGRGPWLVCDSALIFEKDLEPWTDGSEYIIGVLSDATKSVSRAYINNFQDKGKQTAIDMFLVSLLPSQLYIYIDDGWQGNLSNQRPVSIFDPIHDSVGAALEQRYVFKVMQISKPS